VHASDLHFALQLERIRPLFDSRTPRCFSQELTPYFNSVPQSEWHLSIERRAQVLQSWAYILYRSSCVSKGHTTISQRGTYSRRCVFVDLKKKSIDTCRRGWAPGRRARHEYGSRSNVGTSTQAMQCAPAVSESTQPVVRRGAADIVDICPEMHSDTKPML
jgi:hypothetical protein